MISLVLNSIKCKFTYSDVEQIDDFPGWRGQGGAERGVTKRSKEILGVIAYYLDFDNSFISIYIYQIFSILNFKQKRFIVCLLFLIKVFKKEKEKTTTHRCR